MKLRSISSGVAATLMLSARLVLADQPPVAAAGDSATANADAPEIQFETPIFDFNKAMVGEFVKHDYTFTNTGKAKLVVSAVEPKCGCTMTSPWTKEVEPGKTGVIPIQFNTTGYGGPVTKYVGVTCNAKTTPSVILQLKGNIYKLLEASPQTAILTVLSDSDSKAVSVVQIVNHGETPITLSAPQCDNHGISAELKTIKPGKEFELTVRTVPPVAPGNGNAVITMKTTLPQMPVLTVQALLFSRPAVMVSPSTLMLPPGPFTGVVTNSIRVINLSSNYPEITLSDPSVNMPGVGAKIGELSKGKSFVVMLTFPPGFDVPTNGNIEVTFKSSHPLFKEIKVPVIQRSAMVMPRRPPTATLNNGAPVRPPAPMPPGVTKLPPPGPQAGAGGP